MGFTNVGQRIGDVGQRTVEGLRATGSRIITPQFVEVRLETATRGGQLIAATMLIVLIPISLTLVRVFQRILISIFLRNTSTQDLDSAPFAITLTTLIMVCVAVWFWFQWVRTAGFGLTNIPSGGG